jgi:hypothetical protein
MFSDFDRYGPQWLPEVESARIDGEFAQGATVEVRVRGKEIQSTVVELDAPNYCALESVQGKMRAVYHYRFEDEDGATRVTLHAESEAGSLLLKLMGPVIRRAIEGVDGPSLQNLKRLVESR